MRYAGIAIALAAAWGGLTFLTTAGLRTKTPDDPRVKFDVLVAELHQANSVYLDARHAVVESVNEEHRAEALAGMRDGRVEVLRRMDALVDATIGTPDGGDIAVETFHLSWQLDADLERLVRRFERLVTHYPNHPDLVDPVSAAARAYAISGAPSEWIALLGQLSQTTRDEDLRIGALFIMGQIQMNAGLLGAARVTFDGMLASYPGSDYAPRVRGLIYEIEHLQAGMSAPAFSTRTLDGELIALTSMRGKIVLLNFWATWCPSCVAEIPHLREAYAKLRRGDRPFEIVNVSLDDDLPTLKSVLRNLDMPGIQTWEWKDNTNPVAKLYNVYGLPAWFLIDDMGTIRARNPFGDKLESTVTALSN